MNWSRTSWVPAPAWQHVDWVAGCLGDMRQEGFETIEPTALAESGWDQHVQDCAAITLHPTANSWYMGANVPGKPRVFLPYIGGVNAYRQACDEVAGHGYLGFRMTGPGGARCRDGVIRRMQPDVAGWSAGAKIATVACQLARDAGGPHISGQVLICPAVDSDMTRLSYQENGDGYILTTALMRWFWDHYADPADRGDPRAAPLRDEGVAYARALEAAGVPVRLARARGHPHVGDHGRHGHLRGAGARRDRRGAQGFLPVDASAFPVIPSVNPVVTVMVTAERVACLAVAGQNTPPVRHEISGTERAWRVPTSPVDDRPHAAARKRPFGLTRRESEALDLICAERTNTEIAAKLFLSVKTVDRHVSAVLGKLGMPTRPPPGKSSRIYYVLSPQ